jgi:hypothetical protein
MKTRWITLLALCCSVASFSQEPGLFKYRYLDEYSYCKEPGNSHGLYVSSKPVTNREYLIYLFWLELVYAQHPNVTCDALPFGNALQAVSLKSEFDDSVLFKMVIKNPVLQEYVFNPAYIDYPVAGVNWKQAMAYTHWFTDRYNEFCMMEKKFLRFDPNQLEENEFNTESYLAGQYEGIVGKKLKDEKGQERILRWSDRILVPAFRLPASSERSFCPAGNNSLFRSYPLTKCLKPWNDCFEQKLGSYTSLPQTQVSSRISAITAEWELNSLLENSASLSADSVFSRLGMIPMEVQSDGQPGRTRITEKDSMGWMPYLIIGQTSEKKPKAVKRNFGEKNITPVSNNYERFFFMVIPAIEK